LTGEAKFSSSAIEHGRLPAGRQGSDKNFVGSSPVVLRVVFSNGMSSDFIGSFSRIRPIIKDAERINDFIENNTGGVIASNNFDICLSELRENADLRGVGIVTCQDYLHLFRNSDNKLFSIFHRSIAQESISEKHWQILLRNERYFKQFGVSYLYLENLEGRKKNHEKLGFGWGLASVGELMKETNVCVEYLRLKADFETHIWIMLNPILQAGIVSSSPIDQSPAHSFEYRPYVYSMSAINQDWRCTFRPTMSGWNLGLSLSVVPTQVKLALPFRIEFSSAKKDKDIFNVINTVLKGFHCLGIKDVLEMTRLIASQVLERGRSEAVKEIMERIKQNIAQNKNELQPFFDNPYLPRLKFAPCFDCNELFISSDNGYGKETSNSFKTTDPWSHLPGDFSYIVKMCNINKLIGENIQINALVILWDRMALDYIQSVKTEGKNRFLWEFIQKSGLPIVIIPREAKDDGKIGSFMRVIQAQIDGYDFYREGVLVKTNHIAAGKDYSQGKFLKTLFQKFQDVAIKRGTSYYWDPQMGYWRYSGISAQGVI
jgi:hypothetical protein